MQILVAGDTTAANRRVKVHCVDATDGYTPETGEASGQPQISKDGASWTNTTNTLVAIGTGTYYVELTTGEQTAGLHLVRYASANTREFVDNLIIVACNIFDANALGLAYLTILGTAIPEMTSLPSKTPTPQELLSLLVTNFRNKQTATSTAQTFYKDDGTAVAKRVLSSDTITSTKEKLSTP